MHIQPVPPSLQAQLTAALAENTVDWNATFSSLLTDFLQGQGVPIPELWADVEAHFNPIVDVQNVNDGGFRARVFCWAATGSPERASDASRILVSST